MTATRGRLPGRPLRPRIDLIERDSDYRLFLELPGSAAGDIQLDILDGVLRVSTKESRESRFGADAGRSGPAGPAVPGGLQLSVDFGTLLAGDDLQAVHEHGVLLVTLPKA